MTVPLWVVVLPLLAVVLLVWHFGVMIPLVRWIDRRFDAWLMRRHGLTAVECAEIRAHLVEVESRF